MSHIVAASNHGAADASNLVPMASSTNRSFRNQYDGVMPYVAGQSNVWPADCLRTAMSGLDTSGRAQQMARMIEARALNQVINPVRTAAPDQRGAAIAHQRDIGNGLADLLSSSHAFDRGNVAAALMKPYSAVASNPTAFENSRQQLSHHSNTPQQHATALDQMHHSIGSSVTNSSGTVSPATTWNNYQHAHAGRSSTENAAAYRALSPSISSSSSSAPRSVSSSSSASHSNRSSGSGSGSRSTGRCRE